MAVNLAVAYLVARAAGLRAFTLSGSVIAGLLLGGLLLGIGAVLSWRAYLAAARRGRRRG